MLAAAPFPPAVGGRRRPRVSGVPPRVIRSSVSALTCLVLLAGGTRSLGLEKEADEDVPYWYRSGHPDDPAAEAAVTAPPGFRVEMVYRVPTEQGSWTALALDDQGRLISVAQHLEGLYRISPSPIGRPPTETRVERLRTAMLPVGWSHGLLHAFDSLYVMVSEDPGQGRSTGLYRLRDTDGDDQYDRATLIRRLPGAGEHGPHQMTVTPDGQSLVVVSGNGIAPPEDLARVRTVTTGGLDHLLPPGFTSTSYTPGGWVARFQPDGSNGDLLCGGLRNAYDLAFNDLGDLFTFDSDMEWDLGTPWYRPTRINLVVSGGEYGWRGDAGKWPAYFEDSVGTVLDVGPSSPTGMLFGYGAKFPPRYQQALFALDWTFATIHAIHLEPHGAGYQATREEFVAGKGLPLTDAVIGADGAMYFVVGGRRLGSAVYRVSYHGDESTTPVDDPVEDPARQRLRGIRRALEAFHGDRGSGALEAAWPYLDHPDRWIRYAARLAVEHQPVEQWRDQVASEPDRGRRAAGLLALARQGSPNDMATVLGLLDGRGFAGLSPDQKLRLIRTMELALARGGDRSKAAARRQGLLLLTGFPDPDRRVNREVARVLCYLDLPRVIEPTLALMNADAGRPFTEGLSWHDRNDKYGQAVADMLAVTPQPDRMHFAMMLTWVESGWTVEQRRRYFRLIAEGTAYSQGGHLYRSFWDRIRDAALDQVPDPLRGEMAAIGAGAPPVVDLAGVAPPKGPARAWTTEEALAVAAEGLNGRDPDHGKALYSATTCILCHRKDGTGGSVGPDLSSLGARFALRDVIEAIVEPSKAVSDQYQMLTVTKTDGTTVTGRLAFHEAGAIHLMPDVTSPSKIVTIPADEVAASEPLTLSPMPPALLYPLNPEELRDLLAYLMNP